MLWLYSYEKVPPGNFYYIQREGIYRQFGPTPEIRALAQSVGRFRQANRLPRESEDDALIDIVRFTCERLSGRALSRWCFDTDRPISELIQTVKASPCSTCGATIPA